MIPFKKSKDGQLAIDEQAYNAIRGALRCLGRTRQLATQGHLQSPPPLTLAPAVTRKGSVPARLVNFISARTSLSI
jgi:hypothetical protein